MVYGAHKAMVEIALETATRRGDIDGISLRPGGIVARTGQGAGLKSAFLSEVFWAVAESRDITLPVSETGETWLASVRNVAGNFLHAALNRDLGPPMTSPRSLTLPMTRVTFGDLVAALKAAFPQSTSTVSFAQDDDIMGLFGRAQELALGDALAAGYVSDPDLHSLIQNALQTGDAS
jgi:nucleoside-diphosphate-sugar epimerase